MNCLIFNAFQFQLNKERTSERRKPQIIKSVVPEFNENAFNFTKVDQKEVILTLNFQNYGQKCTFLINNSPLTQFHSLLCPEMDKKHPQVLNRDSLLMMVEILLNLEDKSYKIGYNSPGALASVNHLHYHLLYLERKLYVEDAVG